MPINQIMDVTKFQSICCCAFSPISVQTIFENAFGIASKNNFSSTVKISRPSLKKINVYSYGDTLNSTRAIKSVLCLTLEDTTQLERLEFKLTATNQTEQKSLKMKFLSLF